ncbi:MAG: hypothetical protein LBT00_04755 [Spirochaetaceae bacterium]|nr:hypothetical protein [Spirochaetaceae bacterium]
MKMKAYDGIDRMTETTLPYGSSTHQPAAWGRQTKPRPPESSFRERIME